MKPLMFTLLFNGLLFLVYHLGIQWSFGQDQPVNPKQIQVELFDVDANPLVISHLSYDPI